MLSTLEQKGLRDDYDFFQLLDDRENRTRLWMLVLYALVRQHNFRRIVEVGTRYGVTTAFLARAAKFNGGQVLSIDIDPEMSREAFRRLRSHHLEAYATCITADSHTYSPHNSPVDFVFVDGDHSYESALADCRVWAPHVRDGGLICVHDTADPPVLAAVNAVLYGKAWEKMTFFPDCGLTICRKC